MITLMNKLDDENYIIQQRDVLDVADAFIRENHFDEFLKDIDFKQNINGIGHYDANKRVIFFNENKILEKCYSLYNSLLSHHDIDENYDTYFINFYYLFILYHEFAHVLRKVKYENSFNEENIYTYLYEMCVTMIDKDRDFYTKNHQFFPIEIEANNIGFYKAYSLMSYTKLPAKECKVMQYQYLKSLLRNYQKVDGSKIITPIEKLAEMNEDVDLDKIIDLSSHENIPRSERLNLGLPISLKEYDGIAKEKQKLLVK